jgi:hypothetical protein
MSTGKAEVVSLEAALASLPAELRSRLVKHYVALKQAFVQGSLDSCGSRAGKFSETLIRYIQHSLEGAHSPWGQQINLYAEARRLESLPQTSGPEPLRVFIPRALCFLYTLRSKRGFAHVGGDLDSDPIDAVTCVKVADWCLCELIRVVHGLSLEDAQVLVDTIAARESPSVWRVGGRRRVLTSGLSYKDQALLLLYSDVSEAVLVEDLFEWVEYSRLDHFRQRVLAPLHRARLVEWDRDAKTVQISPTGARTVEDGILQSSK